MEFSPLYTRRLSGSYSSRNSFVDDALEQLEFNINDISRASSPASVISVSARSEGFRERRHRSTGRADDEYRRKYSRIKSELELEKNKIRHLQEERVEEIRKLREAFENDRKLEMVSLQNRLEEDRKKELARFKEELIKQKDFELQQVLMYKESEKRQQVKADEKKDKGKQKVDEEKLEVEDEDESIAGRDGDNDVATVSGKGQGREGGKEERRRQRVDKKHTDDDLKHLDLVSKDGGSSQDHKRSRSHRTMSGSEGDTVHRRRHRAHEKSEKHISDVHEPVILESSQHEQVKNRKNDKHISDVVVSGVGLLESTDSEPVKNRTVKDTTSTQDAVTSASRVVSENVISKVSVDVQTDLLGTDITGNNENKVDKENEKTSELEKRIKDLEVERSALQKQASDIQRHLEIKTKEYKIREDEFMNIKSRYEKEFRTVIDEHKKVALVNLEKLKQAETALKESTMSDEDMAALISFRQNQQQRRLSSGSIGSLQDESRKEDREKEKVLQKKLGELTTQVQRLERRISLLRTENDALRQKQDDQRPLEEKIKSLKKRNAELAAIARRLEEKAKNLQQENTKVKSKSPGTTTKDEITQDSDTLKRMLARQRAKDLAEHAKTMLAKDKEIEDLRRKCQQLANQLSDADLAAPVNAVQFEEKEELVNIIKQAAKERLQLEQQLAHTRTTPLPDSGDTPTQSSDKHKQELEAANQILHHEIEKLEQALHKAESLEQQLTDKTNECQALTRELTQSRRLTQQLQVELGQVTEEKKRLVTDVAELTAKVSSIDQITEECNTLKLSLATAQKEREAAHEEVQHLNLRVHSLENLVRDLQESAESVSQLENERKLALSELQQKQAQLEQFQKASSSIESEHTQVVNKLNLQVLELEEKRKREEERREELSREVQRLKKEADERQRILEEAELLRAELARIKQEAVIRADTSLAPSHHPAVVHTQLINRGKGDNHGEGGEVEEVMDRKRQNQNERPMAESFLSAWAQKGPIQVYIAKYNYDPFEFSPNENPEAELPLTAGDYVLVVGEMDEDGFFDGELIDGRQGLVPSNFIEKVEDEDLAEFHAALMQAGHPDYTSASTTAAMAPLSTGPIISNNKLNNNNNNELDYPVTRPKTDLQNGAGNLEESNSDLEDIAEIDEETASVNSRVLLNGGSINHLPPSPRGLSLDRQLTNSLLISWKDPEPATGLEVQSYHIFVDGHFKTSVKSNERTKALLEGVNSSSVHRVCVRCLSNKGQSKDAQCTMLVGKDVYPVPSELKVCHVSPTSAALSWLPGDSNFQHSILVNGKEVRVVKPGVFRHTLTGLTPGALHKVTLIAKSISGTLIEEKSRKWVENVSACIEFHTPEAGAPEPPLNVQIESGPREGTILVSWLPVTINSSGVCNGAVVAGYHVMADNRRAKNVLGPTCDHVVLSSEDFKGLFPSHIAVRTVSTSGVESVNSDVVTLPNQLIKELKEGSGIKSTERAKASKSSSDDGKGHDTDEEIEAAFREAQSNSDGVNAIMGESFSDTSSSELSDIPEVEEDLIGSQDSHLNEVGMSRTNQMQHLSQTEKRSPQPAPRKLANAGADTGPKEFHDQKPKGDLLAAPARVVPAIEITRDSSTERTSADEDLEDGNIPSAVNTPTSPHGRSSDPPISSHYWGDVQKPSAFRQVDQTRRHDSGEPVRFDDGRSNSPAHVHPAEHPTTVKANDPRSFPETQSPSKKQGGMSSSGHNPNQRKHIPSELSGAADEGGDNDSISGEINPVVDENSVRLFIALFDYDPTTMSPNVDSIDEELPFREGQILKVFGDKDADGFYKGESHGRRGYIPCNMVSEVQIDDPDLVEQLLKETTERLVSSQPSLASATRDLTPNGMASIPRDGPMRRMVALYDYDPQELSPNVDAELELSFKTGDIVLIYGEMDEDGFFTGEVNGQQGLVPSNFLQPAPLSDDEGLESVSVVSTARSRSGESLDAAVSALGRADVTANRVNESAPTRSESASSNRQPPGGATEGTKSDSSRPGTASPAEEEKPKKKGGFLNKSKNIFKKFTR